jgi:4-hydroxy-tetrahydrodipicolinate synthase
MLALGGAGHISATANVLPEPVAELAEAAFRGDWSRARELHFELLAINEAIFFDTNPVPVKAMLAELGQITGEVRPPLVGLSAELSARTLEVLARYSAAPHA